MIAIDLSKQQALDADSRAVERINFTANLNRAGNTTIFFIIEEAKETGRLFTINWESFVSATSLNTILLSNLILISIKWHNATV